MVILLNHVSVISFQRDIPLYFSEEGHSLQGAKAYREHCQTCKMELFAEINNVFQWLNIFTKFSILDM